MKLYLNGPKSFLESGKGSDLVKPFESRIIRKYRMLDHQVGPTLKFSSPTTMV